MTLLHIRILALLAFVAVLVAGATRMGDERHPMMIDAGVLECSPVKPPVPCDKNCVRLISKGNLA